MNKDNLEYTINIFEYTIADKKLTKFVYAISLFEDVQVLCTTQRKEYLLTSPTEVSANPTGADIISCVVKSENISDFLDSSIVREAYAGINQFTIGCNITHTNVSKN